MEEIDLSWSTEVIEVRWGLDGPYLHFKEGTIRVLDITGREIRRGDLCLVHNSYARFSHVKTTERKSQGYYDKGDRFISQEIEFLLYGKVSIETLEGKGTPYIGQSRELCVELGDKSNSRIHKPNVYDPESDFQMTNILLLCPREYLYTRFMELPGKCLELTHIP